MARRFQPIDADVMETIHRNQLMMKGSDIKYVTESLRQNERDVRRSITKLEQYGFLVGYWPYELNGTIFKDYEISSGTKRYFFVEPEYADNLEPLLESIRKP